MSVEAMAWAFSLPLPPCPKSVLVALANRANEDGFCWPGLDDLELRTGWKRRAIQGAIHDLTERGLLDISARFSPKSGVQLSNLYRLVLPGSAATIPSVEGAPPAPYRAPAAPSGVHQLRGEGAPPAPESSSEQSVEQTREEGGALALGELSTGLRGPGSIRHRAKQVLAYLNDRAGKHFPPMTPAGLPTMNLADIEMRLKEGYSDEQCRQVIDWKTAQWKGKTDRDGRSLDANLRPSTLFGRKNFGIYIGEVAAGQLHGSDRLPTCLWYVPLETSRFQTRPCGAPIDLAQAGPPKPYCAEHLPKWVQREQRRMDLLHPVGKEVPR